MFSIPRCALFGVALVVALASAPVARAAGAAPDIARGEHIASAMAHCMDCHGADLGGGQSFALRGGERVVAGNLTSGAGGVGGTYSDEDYARAIRLGVRPDGSHLAVMPSRNFAVLTDSDVASLVAYIRSVAPVDRGTPPAASGIPASPAAPRAASASPAADAPAAPELPEGAYLARLGGCLSCHGATLHGASRGNLIAPDISHGGIGAWSAADFTAAMRTGRTPSGHALAEPMPWRSIGRLTDAELDALYRFLQAAPARTSPAT